MKKTKRYTFTFSIITLILGLASFLSISLIGHNYVQSSKNSYSMIQKRNVEVRKNIIEAIKVSLQKTSAHLKVLVNSQQSDDLFASREIFTRMMWEMLLSDEKIASIYIADQLGNFFQARRTPEFAMRTIDVRGNVGVDEWAYKNTQFETTRVEYTPLSFDPRERTWFKQAVSHEKFYWSEPYAFASTNEIGITVSYPYMNPAGEKVKVAGIDFTIASITKLLQEQSVVIDGPIVIVNPYGDVIASSLPTAEANLRVEQLPQEIRKSYEQFLNGSKRGRVQSAADERYLFAFSEFPADFGKQWYIGTFLEEKKVTQEIDAIMIQNIVISLLMMVIIIVVTWFFLRHIIIAPVDLLKTMSDNVATKQYDAVHHISTRIKEFYALSHSMVLMARSIKTHEKAQENLMESFIKLIASAIDDKSPYTGGHCERVPELASMLAEEANKNHQGIFKKFNFKDENAWREFRIAALLHDCGKVTTPEYVVDKATKLESIHNRIHEIRTRFEVLLRDAHIAYLEGLLEGKENQALLLQRRKEAEAKLFDDFSFLAECNIGGEFMDAQKIERLKQIASVTWMRHFDDRLGMSEAEKKRLADIPLKPLPCVETLLQDKPEHYITRAQEIDTKTYARLGITMKIPQYYNNLGELYNLSIARGTLNDEERYKINEHIIMSIRMLSELPFMDNLKHVPEYACAHHETMKGTGYPRGLSKEQISLPARIIAIADIFEALTASDRPYKKAKTISEAIKILSILKMDEHIDGDLFELFLRSGVYLQYAKKYLKPEQIDEVDITQYLSS
ncbi:HD domain-containing phosphohydrolase [Sulfurospirillum diekertiae]|uniref:3'3'-cGAMP-specific phosphodiesterase 1 n=1 Tax=Sulfurospirillum diekertiae TaxID=1854492 RepID=A0A1Y0HNW9_9BACT|nr:HD domain-containing phosphohydrolase [Sulfurospirillum diekertiae]ARU49035.1 3'3'-cGAMP-specific phosphodiesterase 1 [Sulfurospirillum diekertiae]ASC93852.1 3'3'-cGAMP-specific phosphodiesterase 1 [Sulfurospirillum diekertiae]